MIESSASITYNEYSKMINEFYDCSYCGNKLKGIQACNCKGNPLNMTLNGKDIKSKDVPEHRKVEKPQLTKQDDTMWKSIKKFALKRLLPFLEETASADVDITVENGKAHIVLKLYVLEELVYSRMFIREL